MEMKRLDDPARLPGNPLAPFWARSLAFVFDAAAIGAAWYALWTFARPVVHAVGPAAPVIQYVAAFLYFFVFESFMAGQTPGKIAMNLQIARRDTMAVGALGTGRGALRAAMKIGPFAIMLTGQYLIGRDPDNLALFGLGQLIFQLGLGFFLVILAMLVVSPAKQGLHDLVVGTVVGREPIGAALREAISSPQSLELEQRMRPRQTAAVVFVFILLMTAWKVKQHHSAINDPERRAAYEYRDGVFTGATALEIKPVPGRHRVARVDDSLSTATFAFRYWVYGQPTAESLIPLALEKVKAVGDEWAADPQSFKTNILGGAEKIQVRELSVEVVDHTTVFGLIPFMDVLAEELIDVRLPPDAMLGAPEVELEAGDGATSATAASGDE